MPSQSELQISEVSLNQGHLNSRNHDRNAKHSAYKRSSLTMVAFAFPDEPNRKFSQDLTGSAMEEEEQNDLDIDEEEEEKEEEVTELENEEIDLKDEMNKIIQQIPTLKSEQVHLLFDVLDFPPSYRCNSSEEKKMLNYIRNFESQFFAVYPNRKPLLLCPVNECNVKKFVCTTLKPTMLAYAELSAWKGAASFVADHIVYTSLEIPYQLPERLLSPSTILLLQHANCFELSTLLTSLLLGAGYDAYVVSGYAALETCSADESKDTYPWPEHYKEKEQEQEEKREEISKAHDCRRYGVREPNQFQSSFERLMAEREAAKLRKKLEKTKQEEEEMHRKSELDKQYDELRGQRVHCWILVLPGCRGVAQPFFIESTTGQRKPLTSARYLGIECLWNHQNLWVNMQMCGNGLQDLHYDLDDTTDWESVLPLTNSPSLCIYSIHDLLSTDIHHKKEITVKDKTDIRMPCSWVEYLSVTQSDFQLRYPQGYKRRIFKGVQLENFATQLMPTGLTRRLMLADGQESNSFTSVLENFKHRSDKLLLRHIDLTTGWIVERFHPGHLEHIKEHRYRPRRGQRTERHLLFYPNARADGLEEVNDRLNEFRQRFSNRSDCLRLRLAVFDGDEHNLSNQTPRRQVANITEQYDRNIDKPSHNDISTVVYDFLNHKVLVTYHSDDARLTHVWRRFMKPEITSQIGEFTPWEPDCYSAYLNHPRFKEFREFEKYQLFTDLLKSEEQSMLQFLAAERQIMRMANSLRQKDEDVVLEQAVFTFRQYTGAKNYKQELKSMTKENSKEIEDLGQRTTLQNLDERIKLENLEERWPQKEGKSHEDLVGKKVLEDKSPDYMSPFLCQLEDTDVLSHQTALRLRRLCLDDFKSRMVEQANFIQERYVKASDFLQKKTGKYREKEFLSSCRKAVLNLLVSEHRLQRHKEKASHKFMELERRIESDPRFAKYFAQSHSQHMDSKETSFSKAFPKENVNSTYKG